MSLEKLRINKVPRGSETYSRNSVINNLIRSKIQTEIAVVKQSVTSIIKRQDSSSNFVRSKTQTRLKRQKSYTITPDKINENLNYNPVSRVHKLIEQFIANRQIDSFLIPKEVLQQVHKAREQPKELSVKFEGSDKINYETPENLVTLSSRVKKRTIKQFEEEAWIPNKPEINHMIEDREELIEEKYTSVAGVQERSKIKQELQSFKQKLVGLNDTKLQQHKSHFKSPLSSHKLGPEKQSDLPNFITEYSPTRYHKDDYKSLQAWFDATLLQLAQKASEKKDTFTLNNQLDILYSIYISAWKEGIRLTYIESYEKGILLEKLFYSMLRLFANIISQQHVTARQYQISREKDVLSIKEMLQQRCDKLNKNYEQNLKVIQELNNKIHRLSLGFIAYQKVNQQLMEQAQFLSKTKSKSEFQLNAINRAYVKALENLNDKGLIQMEFNEPNNQVKPAKNRRKNKTKEAQYKTFYMIGKDNKPQILGRFKYVQGEKGEFQVNQENNEIEGSEEMIMYNKKLKGLDNEINRFWSKKQEDLEIRSTISAHLMNIKIQDASTGTVNAEPSNFGCQFPESGENITEKLLEEQKRQLQTHYEGQINVLKGELSQKQKLLEKWISNNESNTEKIKNMQENINSLQSQLKKQKEANQEVQKESIQVNKQLSATRQRNEELIKNKQFLQNQIELLKQTVQSAQAQMAKAVDLMEKQKENNNYLVRNNLKAQEKAEKQQIRHENLLAKVKGIAPFLEEYMGEVGRAFRQSSQSLEGLIDLDLLQMVSNKIEFYLGDYVEKDSGIFNMTKI